ncbi:MAG: DUF6781 family protein [Rubrivivax sp.]
MPQPMFDQEALIAAFENATARGGKQLREAASQATLQALQGREMTLKNIRSALKSVSEAASLGAMRNTRAGVDPEALLEKAVAGMDDALLRAVDANRTALQQFLVLGSDMREKHLRKALDDLDKFEETMFAALRKTAQGAGAPLSGAWEQVLSRMQAGGTASGAQAAATAEQVLGQAQQALRAGRQAGLRTAQALAEGYAAMVSGVLVGMSEALKASGTTPGGRGGKG